MNSRAEIKKQIGDQLSLSDDEQEEVSPDDVPF